MKKKKMSFTTVGGSSILTIFAVLCFIVFALLSLSTAKADSLLANKSLDAEKNYYAADMEAEEILAAIRSGECPEGVGSGYFHGCVGQHTGDYGLRKGDSILDDRVRGSLDQSGGRRGIGYFYRGRGMSEL